MLDSRPAFQVCSEACVLILDVVTFIGAKGPGIILISRWYEQRADEQSSE